jgi:hypothetical protein
MKELGGVIGRSLGGWSFRSDAGVLCAGGKEREKQEKTGEVTRKKDDFTERVKRTADEAFFSKEQKSARRRRQRQHLLCPPLRP